MSGDNQNLKSGKNRNRKRRGRGEGAVYQRGDGLWVGTVSLGYDEHGKRRRKVVYGQTKQEVQERLRQTQTDAALGRLADRSKFKVADFLELWLETVARVKTAPTTHARYRDHVRLHLAPCLGSVRLDKLTALHVSQLYSQMEQAGESPAARQKVGKCLRQALRHAVDLGLIPSNPALKVALPKVPKADMLVYDPEQTARFLQEAQKDRLYALYVTAIDTGMRQGELFGLALGDIDFTTGSIFVQRSLENLGDRLRVKELKTEASRRRIQLAAFTVGVLHEHRKAMLAEGHAGGPVFCDTTGGHLRRANFHRDSFKRIVKRAGLPDIPFHNLRHTCATMLLLNDESAKVVSERLGHRSIEITLNVYSHVLPTMQKRAAEKMDLFFRQTGKTQEA